MVRGKVLSSGESFLNNIPFTVEANKAQDDPPFLTFGAPFNRKVYTAYRFAGRIQVGFAYSTQ